MMSDANRYLLRATLCEGDAALAAWRGWRDSADFENLSVAAYRLLPLLYENMARVGLNDPLMPRLKGVYKRSWLEVQTFLLALAPVLDTVGEDALVGEARFMREGRIRPIAHATFATPQPKRAAATLKQLGWQPRPFYKRLLRPSIPTFRQEIYSVRLVAPVSSALEAVLCDRVSFRPNNCLVLLADLHHLAQTQSLAPFEHLPAVCQLREVLSDV